MLTPITFVSGGVNSQFAYLLSIIPIFIALVRLGVWLDDLNTGVFEALLCSGRVR